MAIKTKFITISAFVIISSLVKEIQGHTYHIGKCPPIEPVNNFNMEKFLGKWYVIERTNTQSRDFYLTYAKGAGHNEYTVSQWSTRGGFVGSIVGSILGRNKTEVGQLTLGKAKPGKMTVKFPINPASYDYTVFMTDYETYAGVFSCQELLGTSNRRMANILSREPTLEKEYIDKVRQRMGHFGVNPYDLKSIYQSGRSDAEGRNDTLPVYDLDVRLGTEEGNEKANYTFFKR